MVASFVEASRAIRDALTPFQKRADLFVRLEALEFFIRIEVGILVIKSNNITHMNKVRCHVVQKGACIDVSCNWPVNCVLYHSWLEVWVVFRHLPDFFETDSIVLSAYSIFSKLKVFL